MTMMMILMMVLLPLLPLGNSPILERSPLQLFLFLPSSSHFKRKRYLMVPFLLTLFDVGMGEKKSFCFSSKNHKYMKQL